MNQNPYNVLIQGRHMQVTDALRQHAIDKLQKLERLTDKLTDIHVTLSKQREDNRADVLMHFGHFTVKVHAVTTDMYASIEKAVDKLSHLLHKYKEKIRDHHTKGHAEVAMNVDIYAEGEAVENFNKEIKEKEVRDLKERYQLHTVIRREKKPLKTLTRPEAIIKMELSSEPFMVFRSEEDHKLKVIYRLEDDNFGIIEPE